MEKNSREVSMGSDMRKVPRTGLGAGYEMTFQYGGHRFSGIPVSTLSSGGCSFPAPDSFLNLMDMVEGSALLEGLILEHDELPRDPLRARVAYTVGREPVMVGLEFVDVPGAFKDTLSALVQVVIQHQRSMSGY